MIPLFIMTRVNYDWIRLIKLIFVTIKLVDSLCSDT